MSKDPGTFRILVVDDEPPVTILLSRILTDVGYEVRTTTRAADALREICAFAPNLVITDLRMPDMSGFELLHQVKSERPEIDFILLTAYATVENAVEAMRDGALDYLVKPLKDPDELRLAVARAVERQTLLAANIVLQDQLAEGLPPTEVLFAGIPEVQREIQEVAPTNATVLLLGESGTGKSLVAKAIHQLSRREGPFVDLNCGAIPETLIESELFGHERGAFTGAVRAKQGKFELAQGGTILLDEIGEMPPAAQSKLLRVLQERTFERVGGTTTLTTSARIVAATNQDLSDAIRKRRFREDLYYRLSVFPITLPPLRQREGALPILGQYLTRTIAARVGKKVRDLSDEAVQQLAAYRWPGNIRELYNVLERAIILSQRLEIVLPRLEAEPRASEKEPATPQRALQSLRDLERKAIEEALHQTGGHRRKASELLGISLRSLQYKLKDYGIIAL